MWLGHIQGLDTQKRFIYNTIAFAYFVLEQSQKV